MNHRNLLNTSTDLGNLTADTNVYTVSVGIPQIPPRFMISEEDNTSQTFQSSVFERDIIETLIKRLT